MNMDEFTGEMKELGETANDCNLAIGELIPHLKRQVQRIESEATNFAKLGTVEEVEKTRSQALKALESTKETCSKGQELLKNVGHLVKEQTHSHLRSQPGRQCQPDSGIGSLGSMRLNSDTYSTSSCQLPCDMSTTIAFQEVGDDMNRLHPQLSSVSSEAPGERGGGPQGELISNEDNTAVSDASQRFNEGLFHMSPGRTPIEHVDKEETEV